MVTLSPRGLPAFGLHSVEYLLSTSEYCNTVGNRGFCLVTTGASRGMRTGGQPSAFLLCLLLSRACRAQPVARWAKVWGKAAGRGGIVSKLDFSNAGVASWCNGVASVQQYSLENECKLDDSYGCQDGPKVAVAS